MRDEKICQIEWSILVHHFREFTRNLCGLDAWVSASPWKIFKPKCHVFILVDS